MLFDSTKIWKKGTLWFSRIHEEFGDGPKVKDFELNDAYQTIFLYLSSKN